ncbi:hypothetical protein LUZ61_013109 [Rhynchospora tenuis]|uniref:BHLH domain-containing protein n=1 Tax=Rhynchospora tenuis TaxID=198213 RepID=A0AAD5YZL9_9POAL|nr:hypothetical protein LUZ61_013109 [Rhynchospora tenuis]
MDYCANVSLQDVLKDLCCETPWKYAIYWRLNSGPSQIFTCEDGFVDNTKLWNSLIDFKDGNSACSIEQILADMPHQWFSVGEGLLNFFGTKGLVVVVVLEIKVLRLRFICWCCFLNIGEVAVIGNHKWIFPENCELDLSYKLPENLQQQFSAGIKTILLVPIGNVGVLQLGSLHMVCEDHKLVEKINDLFAGLYEVLNNAKYVQSHYFNEKISSSDCLPDNSYQLPFYTHPSHFPLVENMQFQTFDQNAKHFVWDSSLVTTEEPSFQDGSSIVSNLTFTPAFGTHEIGLCCSENISGLLLETAMPKANLLGNSFGEILTCLTKETGAEHLLEDIINSHDPSEPKQSFNPVTDFSNSYLPKIQIEQVQMPSPLPPSEYVLFDSTDCWSANKMTKMYNSGMLNQIPNRRKVRQDMQKKRPRDRQLIQNRIKELRELIPDGSSCSIDTLLERTVKHMVFLDSVSKQAEKLKRTESLKVKRAERDDIKRRSQFSGDMGRSQKENKANMGPLLIEDLDQPGNILVEMLCMEYDTFLEIANIMKGLQLPILEGVLENRSGQLWAHFVIEVTRGFHRTNIVWPLVQLLQQSSQFQANKFYEMLPAM